VTICSVSEAVGRKQAVSCVPGGTEKWEKFHTERNLVKSHKGIHVLILQHRRSPARNLLTIQKFKFTKLLMIASIMVAIVVSC
jgi:hypothetical protein